MLVIYGNVKNIDSCALSYIKNIRKTCPQVCLLSKITLNSEGVKVLSTLIEDLILFDPAEIRKKDDFTLLNQNEIYEILKEHGDLKAIFISSECDDYMIDELLAAVEKLKVKPILISERYSDRKIDLFIGKDEKIKKCKNHILIGDTSLKGEIAECKDSDEILKYLIKYQCFGPDFEKPSLFLNFL